MNAERTTRNGVRVPHLGVARRSRIEDRNAIRSSEADLWALSHSRDCCVLGAGVLGAGRWVPGAERRLGPRGNA